MSQDFSKGKIYKITNDFNNEVYIGSTCNTLNRRFIKHKSDSKRDKNKNTSLYKLMNEIGFERFRIQLLEDYHCEDKYELRQREGHYIREQGTLNKLVAGREKKEYNKEYYEANKEEIKEYKREKVLCECGCFISKDCISRHKKTNKHINFLKQD